MLTIKFTDGEMVQGGGWNTLPNKPIQKIALIEKNKKIILQDYEEYNFLREYAYIASSPTEQKMIARAMYLMGRKNNKSKVIRLNLIDGSVEEKDTEIGKEYNGRPCTGWKRGI